MVFLLLELHADNQQTLCPAAVDPKRADLHLGQQGIRARPVLTQVLAEVQCRNGQSPKQLRTHTRRPERACT